MKFHAVILLIASMISMAAAAQAATLGPVHTADALLSLAESAMDGDTLLVQGTIDLAGRPIRSTAQLTLSSPRGHSGTLRGLTLHDARISLSDIRIEGSLRIMGSSEISLQRGTQVVGERGQCGVVFSGCGMLLAEPGSEIRGGDGSAGVELNHEGGSFYAGLEGAIQGGSGGGDGIVVNALHSDGAVLVDGDVSGGSDSRIGGSALCLYGLKENAFVSVTGAITGGDGAVGGNGMQIVSVDDRSVIGVSGQVSGGNGDSFGGNALILMNAAGSSAVTLSGQLIGGDTRQTDGEPGMSLLVADNTSMSHAIIDNCMLEDGSRGRSDAASVLPGITSSIDRVATLEPTPFPPAETLPAQDAAESAADGEVADASPAPEDPRNAPEPDETGAASLSSDSTDAPAASPEPAETPAASPVPTDETVALPESADAPAASPEPTGTPTAQPEPIIMETPAGDDAASAAPASEGDAAPTPSPEPDEAPLPVEEDAAE